MKRFICLLLASGLAVSSLSFVHTAGAADTPSTPAVTSRIDDYTAGQRALDKKDWAAAAAAFGRSVNANPRNADSHNMYAYANRWLGDLPLAFKHYAIALEIDPRHLGANEYLGVTYLKNREPEKAADQLKKLEAICARSCPEYKSLESAIAAYKP